MVGEAAEAISSEPQTEAPEAEAGETAEESSEEAAEETESEPETPQKRLFKVNDGSGEREVDEEELVKGYQLSQASYRRMQNTAELQKKLLSGAENPEVLREIYGDKAYKVAEELLYKRYIASLPPEEREQVEAQVKEEQDKAAYRQWVQDQEKERAEAAKKVEMDAVGPVIDSAITEAIEAAGLTMTPRTVARAANYLIAQMDTEQRDPDATGDLKIDAKRYTQRLRDDYRVDLRDLTAQVEPSKLFEVLPELQEKLEALPPEVALKLLPKFVKALRQFDSRKKENVPNFQTGYRPQSEEGQPAATKKKRQTIDEFFNSFPSEY